MGKRKLSSQLQNSSTRKIVLLGQAATAPSRLPYSGRPPSARRKSYAFPLRPAPKSSIFRCRGVLQPALSLLFMLMAASGFSESCGVKTCNLGVRHLEYQGIGFDQGYTSFDLFVSTRDETPVLYFLDTRAHIFNDGNQAVNAGGGWRYSFDSGCHAIGFSAYYDYRNTHRFHYNQIGAGFEYLTPSWHLIANGYFPFGRKKSHSYNLAFDSFVGNNFLFSRKYEFAMIGGDIEGGWHFRQWENIDLFVGGGPYYFQGQIGKSAIGAKVRFEARLTDYVKFEVSDSYDTVFNNRFNAEIAITIPFGPRGKTKSTQCCPCDKKLKLQKWLHSAPVRQEIVVVDKKKKRSLGIDPATGQPYFFIFVNNTSSSNGTFESPYPSLALASAASKARDTIYVFPGDGTTNNMNSGITLKGGQRFLGSGVSHAFQTTRGVVTIPAQTSFWPNITNPGGAVVTMSENNEVSGFNIFDGTSGVSVGTLVGKTFSADINRNQFFYTQGNAIDLTPQSNRTQIFIRENYILSPLGHGINGSFGNAFGQIIVQGNTIDFAGNNNMMGGMNGVNLIYLNASNCLVDVSNNSVWNPQHSAIFVNAQGSLGIASTVNTTIAHNQIVNRTNPTGPMIHILTEFDSIHTSNVNNNRIEGDSSVNGITVESFNNTTNLSFTNTLITNNRVIEASGGINVFGGGAAGNINADISLNAVSNAFQGINLDSGGGFHALRATVSNNTVDALPAGTTTYGIYMNITSTNSQYISVLKNNITSTSALPLALLVSNFADAKVAIENNFFGGNAAVSINNNDSILCVRIQNNTSELGYQINDSFAGGTLNFEYPVTNVGPLQFNVAPVAPPGPGIVFVPFGTCQ